VRKVELWAVFGANMTRLKVCYSNLTHSIWQNISYAFLGQCCLRAEYSTICPDVGRRSNAFGQNLLLLHRLSVAKFFFKHPDKLTDGQLRWDHFSNPSCALGSWTRTFKFSCQKQINFPRIWRKDTLLVKSRHVVPFESPDQSLPEAEPLHSVRERKRTSISSMSGTPNEMVYIKNKKNCRLVFVT
jgi:hypothetical protein